jgi:hypothetical protein
MLIKVFSFGQNKTKQNVRLVKIVLFIIVKTPHHHNILQTNWNHNTSIHHEE